MSGDADTLEGGCACGAVRYRLATGPMFVHCCHCTDCQRETGSAFAENAIIERDRLTLLQGEVELVETPSASGKGQRIARCPGCRVAIYSHYFYGRATERVCFVRVGTLDEPARCPPGVHVFARSKRPWVQLPPGVPAFEAFYDKARDLWPADALARRAALFAAVAAD